MKTVSTLTLLALLTACNGGSTADAFTDGGPPAPPDERLDPPDRPASLRLAQGALRAGAGRQVSRSHTLRSRVGLGHNVGQSARHRLAARLSH